MIGRSFVDFTHPDDRAENFAGFLRLVRGEIKEYRVEKRLLKKDGSIIWSDVTVNLVRDAADQPLRTVTVVQDTSARKRQQEGCVLLLEVTRAIIEHSDTDAALVEAIFEKIRSQLDVDICFNYLLDAAQLCFEPTGWWVRQSRATHRKSFALTIKKYVPRRNLISGSCHYLQIRHALSAVCLENDTIKEK